MQSGTRLRTLIRVTAFVGAFSLVATACGDDGGNSTAPPDNDDPAVAAPDDDGAANTDDEPTDRSGEIAGAWTITTYQLAGALGEADPVGPDPATIDFSDDGTFTFFTGCNTGGGEWESIGVYQPESDDGIVEGQRISFDGLFRTEIGCAGELGDQDLAIPGAIRATELFVLDGATVTLYRDGNLMIKATR